MAKHGGIKDSGEYFVISPTSRKVIVPHTHKSIGTVGDHYSEQITFMCPQMVDGHDISQCAQRYVSWINVNNEIGHDELKLTEVEQPEEGMVYLAWSIRNSMTVAKGIVHFSVHFEDNDANGDTLYRWSTATCKDCDILESINGALGAYETMYVSGETLVISDHTLVNNGTLNLETYGIFPTGTRTITDNEDDIDVTSLEKVNVRVNPPSGTLNINRNGTHFVAEYALVNVNVPDSINPPSGTLPIDRNGTHDVAQYAEVYVEVPRNVDDGAYISIANNSNVNAEVYYLKLWDGAGGGTQRVKTTLYANGTYGYQMLEGSFLICNFQPTPVDFTYQADNVDYIISDSDRLFVFRVTRGAGGTITFENKKG